MKKIIGFFVCILLIITVVSGSETMNDKKDNSNEKSYIGKMSGDERIIIDEDFEEDWDQDSDGDLAPPFLWEVEQTTTEINDGIPCWWHQYEEMGEKHALLWWGTDPQDEWLMTRTFDLSVYMKSTLEFLTWNHGYFYGHWEGDFVKVSIDGGSNWDVLANLYDLAPSGSSYFGEPMSFDLTPYCGNSYVTVAFHRVTENPNMNAAWWMIDDVLVTANDMISFPILNVKSISGGFGVNVELENVGTGDATNVEWNIGLDGGLILFGKYKEDILETFRAGDEIGIDSFVFGLLKTKINVKVDDIEETLDVFLLGSVVIGEGVWRWIPADSVIINYGQCTVTVNVSGITGKHAVKFVDNRGLPIGIESGWDFSTTESATGNVPNWIKTALYYGGNVYVKV